MIDEKPKHAHEKAKQQPHRVGVILLMLFVFGFLVFAGTLFGIETIRKMQRTAILELTATEITRLNATAANAPANSYNSPYFALTSYTAIASQQPQATVTPPASGERSGVVITFMYLDQNHTPFMLPATQTPASPFPTNPVTTSSP